MEYEEDERCEGPQYRQPETIGQSKLREGLLSLALFGSDPNMCQQAFNLELIDRTAMQLETQLLRKQFDELPFGPEAAFLNALSQMWIFAAYELIRTWRQRAADMVKWADSGGLKTKLEQLRKEATFTHFGREIRARQIETVIANPTLLDQIRADLRRTYMPFTRIEAIRVSIAKHEVRGRLKSVALMPTYGRINQSSGSLDYELGHESVSLGTISRRDIADDLRAIPKLEVPTEEAIKSFDAFMHGPSAEELSMLFANPPDGAF